MSSQCAGQNRELRLGLYRCPNCNAEIEMFSNEIQVKCYQCGEPVYREKVRPCIEWCTSAHNCLAEERWKQAKKDSK